MNRYVAYENMGDLCKAMHDLQRSILGNRGRMVLLLSKSTRSPQDRGLRLPEMVAQDFGRDCAEPCPRPAISLPRGWISGKMIKPRYRYGAITALYSKRGIPGRLPWNEKRGVVALALVPKRPSPCWSPPSCVRSFVVEPTFG
jgi:hypothetical protein